MDTMIYYKQEDVDRLLQAKGVIYDRWKDLPEYWLCDLSYISSVVGFSLATQFYTGPRMIIPYVHGYTGNNTIWNRITQKTLGNNSYTQGICSCGCVYMGPNMSH
jgi:hypothetical protein